MASQAPISEQLLRERYGARAQHMLNRVKPIFLENSSQVLREMQVAQEARDAEAFWQAAHNLFGTSGALCAPRLEELSNQMQVFGRTENWGQIDLLMPVLNYEFDRLLTYLSN